MNMAALLACFAGSGMCALIYQLVWTRYLGLIVGNFATATATVVTVFMGGLALGNLVLGRRTAGMGPRAALRFYARLEAVLAVLAALSPALLSSSSPLYPALAGASGSIVIRLLLCCAVLLPPTLLMGGTLPALVQTLSAAAPASLGPLYALNTVGGAIGPLLAAFVLMPLAGFRITLWSACALNGAIAFVAFRLAALQPTDADGGLGIRPAATPRIEQPGADGAAHTESVASWIPYLLAGASGLTALGFEIALTRFVVLTITGGSVYGFAMTLSAFLFGIALGALLIRLRPPASPRGALLAFAAAQAVMFCFALTTPFWDALPTILVRLWWNPLPFWATSGLDFAIVAGLLLILTTASGFALPALAGALELTGGAGVGRLFAANTLGAVIGAPLTGFVLLPYDGLGLNGTLLVLGSLALLSAAAAAAVALPRQRLWILLPVPFLIALNFGLPDPDRSIMNSGMYNRPAGFRPQPENNFSTPVEAAHRLGRIVYQKDSLTARITVRAISPMEMSFVVNGKPDGSTSLVDMYTQIFMAHLSTLTHPHPRKVLVIGCGTGTTTGCLTLHPEIEEIHLAEIEPAQIEVARIFYQHNYNAMSNPKVHIHLDDARHFLLTTTDTYDVIVSEPSNLWVSGMVNLFTLEFYREVQRHLNPGGVFFQWIHYYRVSPDDVAGMLRTFTTVFPNTSFWVHQFGDAFLLAHDGPAAIDMDDWLKRLSAEALTSDLHRIQLSPNELFGFYLWGPADIARYCAHAPVCTDDWPFLEFTTPRVRYSAQDVQDIRIRMQRFGPLEPMLLVRETAAIRLGLGDQFYGRGSFARAEAEYRRALALKPGSDAGKRKLDAVLGMEKLMDAPRPAPATAPEESFTK